MARVFVSHASADLQIAEEVLERMRAEGHRVFLDRAPHEGIRPGEEWKQKLYHELRAADVVVCIVSAAFLKSEWCTAEVGIADCLGGRLLLIKIDNTRKRHRLISPLIEKLQVIDYQADRRRACDELVAELRRVDLPAGRWREGENPYPGLSAFTAEMAPMFVGRESEIQELEHLLRQPATTAPSWTVISGISGCGKSSLLRAGVIPRLSGDPSWVVLPPMEPGPDPVDALARQFAVAGREDCGWSLASVHSTLRGDNTERLRMLVEELLTTRPPASRVLLPIDQAEELFRPDVDGTRVARFIELVASSTDGPVRVVATLRLEYLVDLQKLPGLAGVDIKQHILPPLGREMLRLAVAEPARRAGLVLTSELVARLVDDTGSGEALPLLAFTLQQLAEGRRRGDTLSDQDYRNFGGVKESLARRADATLVKAVAASRMTEEHVIKWLVALATLDDTGQYGRRRVRYSQDAGESWYNAMREFVEGRLATTGADNEIAWVEVAHEAFLTHWPKLKKALHEHTERIHARRAIEQGAADWERAGRTSPYLWDAARLSATLTVIDDGLDPTYGLSEYGQDFLAAAKRYAGAIRLHRRLQLVAISTLLIVSILATSIAAYQRSLTRQEQLSSAARYLIVEAIASQPTDPRLAVQLALAAHHLDPSQITISNLVTTIAATHHLPIDIPVDSPLNHHGGPVNAVAFSPDGMTLATADAPTRAEGNGTVRLWNMSDPAAPRSLGQHLTGHTGPVNTVTFSPDGRSVATSGDDATVFLWDLSNPSEPRPITQILTGHTGPVRSVAFSPDGRIVATSSDDATTRLWNVADRAAVLQLGRPLADPASPGYPEGTPHGGPAYAAMFSPNSQILAAAGAKETVRLWNVADPAAARPMGDPLTSAGVVYAVAFSPDGRKVATASADRAVRLWDVSDPATPRMIGQPLTGHTAPVYTVKFSPDGSTVATGSGDRTVRLWDVTDPATPRMAGQPFTGHTAAVYTVDFSPDGNTVATGSGDRTVRLWDVTDGAATRPLGQPLPGHVGAVNAVKLSPNAHTLATAGEDRTLRLWDVAYPEEARNLGQPFVGHSGPLRSIDFSPNGRMIATASDDATARLWDVTDPAAAHPLSQLVGHNGPLRSIVFSPNGRMIATASDDATIRLWDVTDPAAAHPFGNPLTGHIGPLHSVAFSPDGRTLASVGDDATVRLWDIVDPAVAHPIRQLTGHIGAVYAVAFSPDGHVIATAGDDGGVRLWDMVDPATAHPLGQPLTAHTGAVRSAIFAVDGPEKSNWHTLATASDDATVRLWDVTDPVGARLLGAPLAGQTRPPRSVTFSMNEKILATGSTDGAVRLWDLTGLIGLQTDPESVACSLARTGLTPDDWVEYIPDIDYRVTCGK